MYTYVHHPHVKMTGGRGGGKEIGVVKEVLWEGGGTGDTLLQEDNNNNNNKSFIFPQISVTMNGHRDFKIRFHWILCT